jgi:hypothetical protein
MSDEDLAARLDNIERVLGMQRMKAAAAGNETGLADNSSVSEHCGNSTFSNHCIELAAEAPTRPTS